MLLKNKANLLKGEIDANLVLTRSYGDFHGIRRRKKSQFRLALGPTLVNSKKHCFLKVKRKGKNVNLGNFFLDGEVVSVIKIYI